MPFIARALLAAVLGAAIAAPAPAAEASEQPAPREAPRRISDSIVVGEPFPNVILPSIDGGKPWTTLELRGRRAVLHVFASWWAGCRVHVPVWHEATAPFREDGRLAMAGIVLEQHPDRARLFMDWKGMDWPVAVDAVNRLGLRAVPVTLLIDEWGVVRDVPSRRRPPAEVVEAFLALPPFDPPTSAPAVVWAASRDLLHVQGVNLLDWQGPEKLDDAVAVLRRAADGAPDDGAVHFTLGVALRRRADDPEHARPGDFAAAVAAWRRALELDPNQYIWRRRIQQYGPRLDKPYPFYDWVRTARTEMIERGETPPPLTVEPRGSELTSPSRELATVAPPAAVPPDPEGRIDRDEAGLVGLETIVVPSTGRRAAVRVHLVLAPRGEGHWNNESTPLEAWIEVPEGWQADAVGRRHDPGPAPPATSLETRTLEFELRPDPEAGPRDVALLRGYVLYNACLGDDGPCLFRRADFEVRLPPIE